MEMDKVSERAESFFNAISEEYYLSSSGLKEDSNLSKIYEEYQDLCGKDIINSYIEYSSVNGSDRQNAQMLEFLHSLYQGFLTRESSDELLRLEATTTLNISGEEIMYRQAPVILKNEPDREKRKLIQQAVYEIVERDNPKRLEMLQTVHRVADEFGYDNYSELISTLSGINLNSFLVQCEEFLSKTEDMYTDVASWAFKKHLNLSLEDAATYDSSYLFRMTEFDDYFPVADLLPKVEKSISAMSLDIKVDGNITFDTESRPSKSPRAFCAPISVPDRIMLVIMPQGGLSDYQSFLHELGHAMHYAHTDHTLPMEFRYLGDNSVTESFAILFDHLTLNDRWLKKIAGMSDTKNYLLMANLLELYMLRRYCAKFIYEKELHGNSELTDISDAYSSILTEATKINYNPVNYLNDVDSEFYCVRYLRAWMLQSLHNSYLKEEYGDDWFLNPETGSKLKELWNHGQKLNADEMAKIVSTEKMNFNNLIDSIKVAFDG